MAKGTARSSSDSVPSILPPWARPVVTAAVIAFFAWQAQRVIGKLDELASKVSAVNTRVAVIEERFPQPLAKELQPLTDQVHKLSVEIAELRGAKSPASIPKHPAESPAP